MIWSAGTVSAPSSSASACARSALTSASVSFAPSAASSRASPPPTLPVPCTAMRTSLTPISAQLERDRRLDAQEDALGGERSGIAAGRAFVLHRQARDELGALADRHHVRIRHADVFGGHVAATQRVDGVAECGEHFGRLACCRCPPGSRPCRRPWAGRPSRSCSSCRATGAAHRLRRGPCRHNARSGCRRLQGRAWWNGWR